MADYVERQAAIDAVKHAWAKGIEPTQYIEEIPAANVREDVRGKWLDPDYPICCVIKCSACGETEYLDEPDQYEHWRFCPNCGARMAGGGER